MPKDSSDRKTKEIERILESADSDEITLAGEFSNWNSGEDHDSRTWADMPQGSLLLRKWLRVPPVHIGMSRVFSTSDVAIGCVSQAHGYKPVHDLSEVTDFRHPIVIFKGDSR